MNSYNIFEEQNCSTILYHAIARDEEHVRKLALEIGIVLDGLTIELERKNIKDEMGREYEARIEDAIVH